ncbi:MAG: 4Fe-4S dicluster domain-containing protein [bacterium]
MDRYYVEKESLNNFIKALLGEYDIFGPVEAEGDLYFKKITDLDVPNIIWDRFRTVEPVKSFVNPFLEAVVSNKEPEIKKTIILGIRNCDLVGFDLLDKIFEDTLFTDPFYKKRREETVFIGADCTDIRRSCFCNIWGISAFPEKTFDLSVGSINGGFVLEVATQTARSLLVKGNLTTSTATETHLNDRQSVRNKVQEKLREQNKEYHFFTNTEVTTDDRLKLIKGKQKSPVWDEHSKTCVTCGGCTQVCPTCHCFLLVDIKGDEFLKDRYWDSCQYTAYGRVAGGANPRAKISERLANRYFCKLENRPQSFDGVYGCTGCGRCIEGCQGKIDIRKVLKDISKSSIT